jgi:hypothetical protein
MVFKLSGSIPPFKGSTFWISFFETFTNPEPITYQFRLSFL